MNPPSPGPDEWVDRERPRRVIGLICTAIDIDPEDR
jgi:hypothetical protein